MIGLYTFKSANMAISDIVVANAGVPKDDIFVTDSHY